MILALFALKENFRCSDFSQARDLDSLGLEIIQANESGINLGSQVRGSKACEQNKWY